MTHVRGTAFIATAALLLVAATGCDADGEDPPAPSRSEPAPTTSSAGPSESDLASHSATQIVRKYYVLRDRLRMKPNASLGRLKSVATSTELEAQRTLFANERERDLRQTGKTRIKEIKVKSVNLDNSEPTAGKVPIVEVDVCWDVSDVDILDATGQSIISPDRPDTGWIRYTVANYDWEANPSRGWRVATSKDLEQASCASS